MVHRCVNNVIIIANRNGEVGRPAKLCLIAEGIVQRRVLNIGYTNDQVAEVLSGLTENDLIVVEGHHKLREGSRINMDKAGK